MSLRPLLTYAQEDEAVAALSDAAREAPQRAFVSQSMRPYLLAALLDSEADRPALVVAGDDRAARDLAADLKQFLDPRPVRLYPARGVRYESHLAPPPHLVGLRIAALDALVEGSAADGGSGEGRGPGRRRRRRGARREGARPRAAPARLRDREGRPASTSTRPTDAARRLRLRARRAGRGARPVRDPRRHPRRLPGHRGARGALRAVRHRGRAADLLLDVHAALARGGRAGRDRARRRARRPSIASWPRSPPPTRRGGRRARPDVAERAAGRPLRRAARPGAGRRAGRDRRRGGDSRRRCATTGRTSRQASTTPTPTTSTSTPERLRAALDERAALRLSRISGDQPHSFRAQAADTAARSLEAAEPELEKLVRSGYRTVGRRGRAAARPSAPPTTSPASAPSSSTRGRDPSPRLRRRSRPRRARRLLRHRHAARGLRRARLQARDRPRPPAAAPPPRRARPGRAPAPAR